MEQNIDLTCQIDRTVFIKITQDSLLSKYLDLGLRCYKNKAYQTEKETDRDDKNNYYFTFLWAIFFWRNYLSISTYNSWYYKSIFKNLNCCVGDIYTGVRGKFHRKEWVTKVYMNLKDDVWFYLWVLHLRVRDLSVLIYSIGIHRC